MTAATRVVVMSNKEDVKHRLKEKHDYRCQKCNYRPVKSKSDRIQAHHIIPESEGGDDTFSNLVPLCKRCHDGIPSPHPLVEDYESMTEDYLDTDLQPSMDVFYFGMLAGERGRRWIEMRLKR